MFVQHNASEHVAANTFVQTNALQHVATNTFVQIYSLQGLFDNNFGLRDAFSSENSHFLLLILRRASRVGSCLMTKTRPKNTTPVTFPIIICS